VFGCKNSDPASLQRCCGPCQRWRPVFRAFLQSGAYNPRTKPIDSLEGRLVTPRTIDQIEKAFRDMGLNETTWGKQERSVTELPAESASTQERVFIRIETTTTPLEPKDANVA
jgi:hypothetical protein